HGLVYLLALLATLSAAGLGPEWLFTGSTLITAVIGLSLRDTFGNLFAGLAIQAQRPFQVGDWIQFDANDNHIGQAVEINWRAALRRRKRRIAQHEQTLRCVDFFERLPDPARRKLAALAESRVYAEDEVILRQGEPGDELFILQRGEVVVSAQGGAQPSLELT